MQLPPVELVTTTAFEGRALPCMTRCSGTVVMAFLALVLPEIELTISLDGQRMAQALSRGLISPSSKI